MEYFSPYGYYYYGFGVNLFGDGIQNELKYYGIEAFIGRGHGENFIYSRISHESNPTSPAPPCRVQF